MLNDGGHRNPPDARLQLRILSRIRFRLRSLTLKPRSCNQRPREVFASK